MVIQVILSLSPPCTVWDKVGVERVSRLSFTTPASSWQHEFSVKFDSEAPTCKQLPGIVFEACKLAFNGFRQSG